MRLQTLILPCNNEYPDMYYRGNLCLCKGETITFDTYFNSFSYTKYRDYTNADAVTFKADFSGRVTVQLCVYDGEEHIISECDAENSVTITTTFAELPQNGFLYPKFIALTDCEIFSGEYIAECEYSDISVCIAICTFRREKFVLRNIEQLKHSDFDFIKRVFVSDNGNTLDHNAISDDFVKAFPNKNFGGSGGFTRGLIEAIDGGYSHVILMDDDVEFHSETLCQMTTFVAILRPEFRNSWISTAMLPLDKPWEQFEMGAQWNTNRSLVHKNQVDIRNVDILLSNLSNPDVEYGGWWTLCMPVSYAETNGLPYPFFIKLDDIEYGMRKPQDTEIITMNGIAIKHEAFDKKTSFVLDYYFTRNEMVVNTIYNRYSTFGVIKRFLYEVGKDLIRYRYDNIPLAFRAANDFLGGVDFFLNCNEEVLNREIITSAPKLVPLESIDGWSEKLRCDDILRDNRIKVATVLTLGGHIIPAFLLKKDIVAAPLAKTSVATMFGRKAVIQYQLSGDSGILAKRNFAKFLKYAFMAVGMSFKLLFLSPKAIKDYRRRKSEIISQEFWRRHLGID